MVTVADSLHVDTSKGKTVSPLFPFLDLKAQFQGIRD